MTWLSISSITCVPYLGFWSGDQTSHMFYCNSHKPRLIIMHNLLYLCSSVRLHVLKPHLHVSFKALHKPVYVKPILCKRSKAVSKPIWLNHIRRWFETGLKRFKCACKQLKRFKPLYKIQALTLPSLLFSKRSPSLIASKPR